MSRDHDSHTTIYDDDEGVGQAPAGIALPCLTLLHHPDAGRVGEQAVLAPLLDGKAVELSRLEPLFARLPLVPGSARYLGDARVSRQPIRIEPTDDASRLRISRGTTRTTVTVDGNNLDEEHLVDLAQGAVLVLAQRITLFLHQTTLTDPATPDHGMLGVSAAIRRVRAEISQVADLDLPVLLRGETGTGKELVAQAIHGASTRARENFVAVNVAAIPPSLAAAELFGAVKGAYTGASQPREGFFLRAQGGSLFLDEVAEMPVDVQVLLLRALECDEIQPVGAASPRKIDVRVIAATDADLEQAIEDQRFRAPLFHRLNGYELQIPPLRERREDIGCLLVHFLRGELEKIDGGRRLVDTEAKQPWLPAELVGRLARSAWPGNVRQLRNAARQLVVAGRDQAQTSIGPQLERMLAEPAAAETVAAAEPEPKEKTLYRQPDEVSEDELIDALRANGWRLKPTATALGVSRTSLYSLIDRCPRIRKAAEIEQAEIERALASSGGDLDTTARDLEVSRQALQRRIKELGLGAD